MEKMSRPTIPDSPSRKFPPPKGGGGNSGNAGHPEDSGFRENGKFRELVSLPWHCRAYFQVRAAVAGGCEVKRD